MYYIPNHVAKVWNLKPKKLRKTYGMKGNMFFSWKADEKKPDDKPSDK